MLTAPALRLGAAMKVSTVVAPRLDLDSYPYLTAAGDTDGLALSLKSVGSARHYHDIHSAIKASPTPEVTKEVVTPICSMILSSMATSAWADFKTAIDSITEAGGARSKKDVTDAHHWVAARTHGQWNDGQKMTAADRSQWLAWGRPFEF